MSYKIDWQVMFEDFREQFPSIAKNVVDCYPCGRLEIVMWLNDGSKVLYNYTSKTMRTMKCRDRGEESSYSSEEEWKADFATVLSRKMRAKNMTQKELAELTGVSSMLISKYMNGKSSPGVYNLMKIAEALECFPTELISFDF